MKTRAAKSMRRISYVSAVLAATAGTLLPGPPASAALAELATPWKLVWLNGTAQGSYTVTKPPFGIGRTYALTGSVASSSAAECYYVRVAGDSLAYDAPRACGTRAVAFALKMTTYTVTPVTIRLCRATPPACGPALPLTGSGVF